MKGFSRMTKTMRAGICALFVAAALVTAPHAGSAATVTAEFSNTYVAMGGAAIEDFFSFMTHANGQNSAEANVEVTGLENVEFALFEADAGGNAQGSAIVSTLVDGAGTLNATGLTGGAGFVLRLTGNIASDVGIIGVGTVIGEVIATAPIAPAILMLLTGIGALFGIAGIRRASNAA